MSAPDGRNHAAPKATSPALVLPAEPLADPGKELPLVIALVELDEGVRMLGELHDVDPDEVSVGLRVEVDFRHGDQVSMPFWRPRQRRSAR